MPFFHVLLQSAVHAKRHVAYLAFINVFARLSVRFHVPRQLAALSARVATKITLVRSLARVAAAMHC